jgi:hypothetical protein
VSENESRLRQIVRIGVEKLAGWVKGVTSMCDYSLHAVSSRPAKVGDRLISTSFLNAITRGFASVDEPGVAVCLLPGSEIAFESAVSYDNVMPFLPSRRVPHKVARFRQVNTKYMATHHDALEFPDGKVVLLHALSEGQRATVLQLPAKVEAKDGPAEVSRLQTIELVR